MTFTLITHSRPAQPPIFLIFAAPPILTTPRRKPSRRSTRTRTAARWSQWPKPRFARETRRRTENRFFFFSLIQRLKKNPINHRWIEIRLSKFDLFSFLCTNIISWAFQLKKDLFLFSWSIFFTKIKVLITIIVVDFLLGLGWVQIWWTGLNLVEFMII